MAPRALFTLVLLLSVPAAADSSLLGEVNDASVAPVWIDLERSMLLHEPTTITINSSGGSVGAGVVLWKQLRKAARVVTVTCIVEEEAASMAAILLQACTKRYITAGSYLMFHEASSTVSGTAREIAQGARDLAAYSHRLAIYASHRMKLTLSQYTKRVSGADWYLSPHEAVKVGAADAVIP